MKKNKNCKALFIGKKFIDYVQSFHTEYQTQNGKSHWVFLIEANGHEYAVEYDPKKEQIEIL